MLTSQRALFDIPRDVCYLNAAGFSPLPRAVVETGWIGVARKSQPWLLASDLAHQMNTRARRAAAQLINAAAEDVALVSSIAYGVAVAGKVLSIARGSRVLTLADDHSSPVLEWTGRAEAQGFTVETIPAPADGDWTAVVLAAIERPGAAPIGLASISSVHWADGGLIDLTPVATALRKAGAPLLIDFTQSAGVMPLDVAALDPDFVLFPTYKWLIGPYGRAFLYVAKRHQGGIPLEQPSGGRRSVRAEADVYLADTRYLPDAARFDMGQRDHFISMEMAALGMEMVGSWGSAAIAERLRMLTNRLADGVRDIPGVTVSATNIRSPHILCIGFRGGMPSDLMPRLEQERVFGARRLGRLRLSPHVYVDEADVDHCIAAIGKGMTAA